MAAGQDYVFFNGLDRSYSSRKRALVLRGHIARNANRPGGLPNRGNGSLRRRGLREHISSSDDSPSTEESPTESPTTLVRTVLDGQGDSDPFQSTAWTRDTRSKFLIDYYLTAGRTLYDVDPGRQNYLQSLLFAETKHQEVCVNVFKTFAASHIALRTGSLVARREAMMLRLITIENINARLSDPNESLSDWTILASCAMIGTEAGSQLQREPEDGTGIDVHAAGMTRLIALRGGFSTLPAWLDWMVHWADINIAEEISVPLLQFASNKNPDNANQVARLLPRSIALCFDELMDFYTEAYAAAAARYAFDKESVGGSEHQSIGGYLSTFYSSLSEGYLNKGDHTRVAVLMFTNLMLMDHGTNTSSLTVAPLRNRMLNESVLSGKRSWLGRLSAFLSSSGSLQLDDRERTEKVARCLYVYKRMTWHTQLRLETALMDLLLADRDGMESVWTPEKLRFATLASLQEAGAVIKSGRPEGIVRAQHEAPAWAHNWGLASI